MTTIATYSTGTVSVAAGATVVVGVGTIWSGVNARSGDDIVIAGHTVIIKDVTDTAHLVIDAWPYASVAAGLPYAIVQRSPLRFAGGDAMKDVSTLVGALNADGFYVFVASTLTVPDPSLGNDGQYAFQPTTGKLWSKSGGAWVFLGVYKGFGVPAPWNSATAYNQFDVATLAGSSYVCILAHTNFTPPNSTYWSVLASIGATGPTGATGASYAATSTTSFLIGAGSKAFTTQAGLAYVIGSRVRTASAANPANYMEGIVTAYSGTTLTVNITRVGGSGTFADWNLSVAGDPGSGDLLSTNNLSDVANKATALNNLTGALSIPALTQVQSNLNLRTVNRRSLEAWLPKWGAARANVLAGVSNAKLLCIGDSTFAGTGAQPSNVNVAPYTFPAQIAQQLTANGLNASWQSRWADGNWIASGPGLATADSRVTMGVFGSSGFGTLGGVLLSATGAVGPPFKFVPTVNVDSFDFYYVSNTGQGSLTLDINGGAATTVNENAAAAMNKVTKTGTLGANTLNVTPSIAGGVYFMGIVAYNSAAKEVSVINAGAGSAKAATFNDTSFFFSSIGAIGFLAPDLTIIDLTINDAAPPTSLATYQANLQAIITAAKVSGDVLLLGGVPSISTYATLANQTAINNMAAAVAAKNGLNFISMFDLWGSQAAINAAGYDLGDGIHMNQAGYAAQAALIAPYLQ